MLWAMRSRAAASACRPPRPTMTTTPHMLRHPLGLRCFNGVRAHPGLGAGRALARPRAVPGGAAREIDHDMLGGGQRERSRRLVGGVADDQHLGVREEGLDALAEQRCDVRDLLLDVAAIRSPQSGYSDAGIEDSHVASLPDERLDQCDHWAFPEVVGPG